MTTYLKAENLDEKTINKIAADIKIGKLFIFPTDTVYGIGANVFLENSCKKIYEIKKRPSYKPLSVLISDLSMLSELVDEINPVEQKLIASFWPGCLTIRFKKKDNSLPDIVSAGDEYVRVRLLKPSITSQIISASKVPIVAPSANLSGKPTGVNIKNILQEFNGKVDYIIDCGDIKTDEVSTIVAIEDEKAIIIREGKISKEEIARIVPIKDINTPSKDTKYM